MRTLLTAAAAIAVLGAALPAAAQSFGRGDRFDQNDSRRIERRIERGLWNGALSQKEARDLSRRLDEVRRVERQALRDGFIDGREAREIDRRYASLNIRLSEDLSDRDDRRHRYGDDRSYRFGYDGAERGYGYRR